MSAFITSVRMHTHHDYHMRERSTAGRQPVNCSHGNATRKLREVLDVGFILARSHSKETEGAGNEHRWRPDCACTHCDSLRAKLRLPFYMKRLVAALHVGSIMKSMLLVETGYVHFQPPYGASPPQASQRWTYASDLEAGLVCLRLAPLHLKHCPKKKKS